ncbi:MAG: phosphoribosylanthranilate isomerase [Candidatus Omnitrophica bacterium]|nr:phosphoribosylanthranilate isomerase [Candidatus Omnitrophota bacterium]
MLIKICGITNPEDARNAVSFGADALGFVFAESPRKIEPKLAKKIIADIKNDAICVGVFVNEPLSRVEETVNYCGLSAVQLHGDETPDYCSNIKVDKVIKAFRIKDETSLKRIKEYGTVFAYLLDAFSENIYGGTGKTFDWNIAVNAKVSGKPVILSGGLNLSNIREAIKAVRPYGVDISSSIESVPGKKDTGLMKRIIKEIKALD